MHRRSRTRPGSSPSPSRSRRTLLTLARLEDRDVPAILYVSPDGSDAQGRGFTPSAPFQSIQYAVNQASSGDTIRVAKGTYTYNQAADQNVGSFGTTAVVDVVNRQLSILGGFTTADGFATSNPQANPTVIDGQNQFRGIFAIQTGSTTSLDLEGFTIRNGLASPIPARASGQNNLDATYAFGGGVFIDMSFNATAVNNSNPFVFKNVTFDSNRAVGGAGQANQNPELNFGGAGTGGGMALRYVRNVQLDNVVFHNNQAVGGAGAERGGVGNGGAIHVDDSVVTANNVTFDGNQAVASSNTAGAGTDARFGERADGTGGAVSVQLNPNTQYPDLVAQGTFTNVTAINNQAIGGGTSNTGSTSVGGGAFGGAFFSEGGILSITDSVVYGNQTTGGAGYTGGLAGGGGIETDKSDLTVNRVKVANNTATSGPTNNPTGGGADGSVGGGGLYLIRLDPNAATARGTVAVTNSVIAANTARTPVTIPTVNQNGGGAGVWLQGVSATFTHDTIADNVFGKGLLYGQAFNVVNYGTSVPSVLTLADSIVSGHTGAFNLAANQPNLAATAINTIAGNTTNLVTDLFFNNTNDTNNGVDNGVQPGTYTGLNTVIKGDPLFNSPGAPNFDYSLKAGSPAVDAAVGSTTPVDIGNKPRVGVPDLGAYELGTPGTLPTGSAATGANATTSGTGGGTVPPVPPPPPGTVKPVLVGYPQFAAGAGSGGGPGINLYNPDQSVRSAGSAFADQSFTGGVRVATADFNGDGVADLVVGTGPGGASLVRVLDGVDRHVIAQITPFEASFTGGVYVAAGDVTGDGVPDVIVTPDQGGGPRVRVYSGAGFGQVADFFGIDDPNFRGGARAAVGDVNGDGVGDLIVAAGFQGGPRVAGFDGKSVATGTPQKIFGDFFAFEQTLRNGVFVAVGDVNGDGLADVIVGGGPGGGPRVTVFDGKSLLANQQSPIANFFAGDPNNRGGVPVAVKNLDGDTRADILTGAGAGANSVVTAYFGANVTSSATPPVAFTLDPFPGFTGGVFVG